MKKNIITILLSLLIITLFIGGRILYMTPSYHKGEQAPEFSGTLVNGASFELKELHGNYVLVQFWGSWCAPCRKENPKHRKLWVEYKDKSFSKAKGFKLVSIAIEVDKNAALRAIKRDRLEWEYHLIDLGESLRFFDTPISNIWGVNQVPSTFLLNPAGDIIGHNLSHEELHAILNKALL